MTQTQCCRYSCRYVIITAVDTVSHVFAHFWYSYLSCHNQLISQLALDTSLCHNKQALAHKPWQNSSVDISFHLNQTNSRRLTFWFVGNSMNLIAFSFYTKIGKMHTLVKHHQYHEKSVTWVEREYLKITVKALNCSGRLFLPISFSFSFIFADLIFLRWTHQNGIPISHFSLHQTL